MGKINRKELVEFHNVVLNKPELDSPLTVGKGSFAYTFDITGMQTLYNEHLNTFPLCTMAEWGWHTTPANNEKGIYTPDDLQDDEYEYLDRKVHYPVTRKPGNEKVYGWLRENLHKFNLARIGFFHKGQEIHSGDLSSCRQELNIYEGICNSEFTLYGTGCKVTTLVHSENDTVCFRIDSKLLTEGLEPRIQLPYPSWKIHGSDRSVDAQRKHTIEIIENTFRSEVKRSHPGKKLHIIPLTNKLYIKRIIDDMQVTMSISVNGAKCECDTQKKSSVLFLKIQN